MMVKSMLINTKALFKSLQQHHITRYYHQEVQSIDRRNGYAVCTDQMSPIEAHKVIVASGAWSSQLLKTTLFLESLS